MGFIAKGANKILEPGSSAEKGSYLYKKMNSDGSYSDVNWGDTINDFDSAITSSTWTVYGAYQYLNIGLVRQVYSDTHSFNRNTRFDSTIRLSNTVTPTGKDVSAISYIIAVVKGSPSDSSSVICQRLIDEFSSGTYNYVLAIGTMARDIDDYRAVNIDVNNIKTFSGTAASTKDYDLTTSEAIYLVNIAICTNAAMEEFTSLAINLYQEYFIEFLGDNYVTPGSIGKTEIDPNYKAERAINNYIMTIDDDHIVDGTIIISPDYATQIDDNSIYYLHFTGSSVTATKMSLGYYDLESQAYVASGNALNVTISGTVAGKVAIAVITNGTVTIMSLL